MEKTNFSVREIAKLCEIKNNVAYRIIMEKERKGLTYAALSNLIDSTTYDEPYIRKALETKKVDETLASQLCKELGIDMQDKQLDETVMAYRYHKVRKTSVGRMSNAEISKRQKLYAELRNDLKANDGYSTEKAILENLSERYYYNGIECEWDMYCELMERDIKVELLKKIVLISELFPEEIEDFMSRFKFDDEDMKELEKISVDFKYSH